MGRPPAFSFTLDNAIGGPYVFGRLGHSDNGLDQEPLVDSVDDFQLHRLIVLMSTAFRGVSSWSVTGTRMGSLVIVPPWVPEAPACMRQGLNVALRPLAERH